MSDTQIINQNLTGIAGINPMPGAWSASSSAPLQYATPVFLGTAAAGATVGPAYAGGSAALAQCVGLSLRECDAAGQPTYVTPPSGPVDFPKAQWDAVTGTAPVGGKPVGLVTGSTYYLSAATPGLLTTRHPASASSSS